MLYTNSANFNDIDYLISTKYKNYNLIDSISITEKKAVLPFTGENSLGYFILKKNILNRWKIERVIERVNSPITADTIKTNNDVSYSIIITNNIPRGTIIVASSDLENFQHTFINNNDIADISIKVINSQDIKNYDYYVNNATFMLNNIDITEGYIKNNQIPFMHLLN